MAPVVILSVSYATGYDAEQSLRRTILFKVAYSMQYYSLWDGKFLDRRVITF